MSQEDKIQNNNVENKTLEELYKMLKDYTAELMNLRVQKSVGQLTAPHRIRIARRNIARVKTLIHLTTLSNSLEAVR